MKAAYLSCFKRCIQNLKRILKLRLIEIKYLLLLDNILPVSRSHVLEHAVKELGNDTMVHFIDAIDHSQARLVKIF